MYVATTEEDIPEDHSWKLNFDGASNAVGNRIGAVLISPNRDCYPFTCKLDFDFTNNISEYEACIMGILAAIERKIKVLEVYGGSALVIYQLKGEWETRDPNLINYRELVLDLIKEDIKLIQMSIYEAATHCCNIDEEEKIDDCPWYHDILRYVKNREYLDQATKNDKRTLRRLTSDYVLDGEILYKMRKDQKDFRGKLMPNWEGPYMVNKAFSGGALILTEMDGKSLPNPKNSDSVKKYFA
ncbi:uncharacterized protein LOC108488334 [Gossypium arboreum]|uniref:uncharacterized protein LOC108488334 n=1 Tax=Gossypium arboreum TaxID=29729 RepID=UPI0008193277|nr:uncharacterized protein LOC108488334 [Gossypium arboreum]